MKELAVARIQNYFNGVADKFESASLIASTAHHQPDIGSNREVIIRDFLQRHLPRRLSACLGGQVISHDGRESRQIDVVVVNDIGIRFDENDKTFVTVESVAGAITVKSTLNRDTLINALQNLASIPDPSQAALGFKVLTGNAFEAFLDRHPSFYVFAYDGMSGERCLMEVQEFYRVHPEIPLRRYPKGIVVNKRYMIRFVRDETRTSSGYVVSKDTLFLMTLEDPMRGYPFVQLLNDLSSYCDWLNYMDVSIHPYFNTGFGLPPMEARPNPSSERWTDQ
ncbi:DUF6602 domain-containing protein [Candidatus Manganitrophus noduliformans]|uniref:DUF6602 domain-containing protein n=1 Tax=Candidatus Manganitrophus noduliformans TaxID=2606439 RepID=A0A7X6DSY4_9BACT|nr:DUF6602 domain-containing protein [Candidatus Manganitrophus noduliformans]NKE72808.1 hypothetical protein [Candidatus Manganitrophus noduliformans]